MRILRKDDICKNQHNWNIKELEDSKTQLAITNNREPLEIRALLQFGSAGRIVRFWMRLDACWMREKTILWNV
ncbi:unnamed protein product [Caenorhabditis angaria]|uniref:Uncharacterized protein n=1 Tax=Caenorhabditis angaria TaxID=860376 RepID=A0A9P1J032_9PELO|nr:unnamed protein product [Caenorhabditis angaria]